MFCVQTVKGATQNQNENMGYIKDKLKAFSEWLINKKVRSNVFDMWKYMHSESSFNTLYTEIK